MKFLQNRSSSRQGISIQPAVPDIAGLGGAEKLEIRALDGAIAVTDAEMTAMEITTLIGSLTDFTIGLIAHLALECGPCEDCGYCEAFSGEDAVRLPEYILEAAGLPPGCKLEAFVDEDGNITVNEADYARDLTDVPPDLLDIFRKSGICMHKLETLLMRDCIVYGNKKNKDAGDECECE